MFSSKKASTDTHVSEEEEHNRKAEMRTQARRADKEAQQKLLGSSGTNHTLTHTLTLSYRLRAHGSILVCAC